MTAYDDWCAEEDDYDDDGNLLEVICPCGTPGCPGYCDDYDTYNLRPGETGGEDDEPDYDDEPVPGNPDDPPEEYLMGGAGARREPPHRGRRPG